MMENNVPFKCFTQHMQEERFHEENDINENASVAMQAPDSNFSKIRNQVWPMHQE